MYAGSRLLVFQRGHAMAYRPNSFTTRQIFAGFILPFLFCAAAVAQTAPSSTAATQNAAQPSAPVAPPQPAETGQAPQTVLKVTTRLVVVDVVARDKKAQIVNDLGASDFALKENGREQKISTFNFQHPGLAPSPVAVGAALPPNIFRNAPKFQSNSTLNVILLDGLNSTLLNQAYVRVEMIKFLEKLPQGQPIAIYALGGKLRLLQDFTTDLTDLKRVIQTFKGESSHALSKPTWTSEVPRTLTRWAE